MTRDIYAYLLVMSAVDSTRNKKRHVAFIFVLCAVRYVGGNDFPCHTSRNSIRNFGCIGSFNRNCGSVVRCKFVSRGSFMLRGCLCK